MQRFFYYPNRTLYADPAALGVPHEIVQFPSLNGSRLTGVYFPAQGESKGTVIHFHGNFGNVSNHFPLALFLTHAGFDVLAFDYQGYGASEGKPTPRHLLEDGLASVGWVCERQTAPCRVALFGQSLGASTALQVAAVDGRVRAVVAEASFTGHRAMGRAALKRSWLTWPLAWILPVWMAGGYDAEDAIAHIHPRPVFLIHGDADRIVPVTMSEALWRAAREPKQLWIVKGAGHLECRAKAGGDYERRISRFFEDALAQK